jgi:DNA-binding response OmpR family regulator
MRILIVEDDQFTAEAIRDGLKKRYAVDLAATGEEGLQHIEENEYDLIILDLNLPDMTGIDICKKVRRNHTSTPILMLTGSIDLQDRVTSLDAGADDFLSKPFNFAELHARLRALSRRGTIAAQPDKIQIGDLVLEKASGKVYHKGIEVKLRRKEFLLLEYLITHPGKIVTRNMLLEHVWESSANPMTNTIDVHVKFLRDRVDRPFGTHYIKTIHGLGYKLEELG